MSPDVNDEIVLLSESVWAVIALIRFFSGLKTKTITKYRQVITIHQLVGSLTYMSS